MTDGGTEDRLEQAAEARRQAQGLRARLEAATRHGDQTTLRVQECTDRLAEEADDVRRLESVSWTRILSSVTGDRLSDLERETAEREAARYALAEARARDETAWREVAGIEAQLEALGDVEAAFAGALAAEEARVSAADPATAARLTELTSRRGALLAEDREAREAHAAGVEALERLGEAQHLLGSAESWSTWDTFGGGGMFTDMMKYDRLDQVADVLRRADHCLGLFSRELADLRIAGVEAVRVDGMTRTFDVFFDNIFSDMAVRSRIREADGRVRQAAAAVSSTLAGLTDRGREIAEDLARLATEREELLLR